jgi:REP element-mobilizing transposase RayT
MNPLKRDAGPNALRRGRASMPHADYFVTLCLQPRRAILVPDMAEVLLNEMQRMTTEGCWTLRCLTVMPDHAHLFFTLGERLTLSQAIARLKTKTQTLVRQFGTDWQNNFYDHKVRPDDSIESIMRYIYLNPYHPGKRSWIHR